MIYPQGATQRTDHRKASETVYDVVVVGSGISGSIIANELSRAGKTVLILEAGPGTDSSLVEYEAFLTRFYDAAVKDNQSPYAPNPNAAMPRSSDAVRIWPGQPDSSTYLVRNGPLATDSTYTRVLGGTTLHWEGKTPRMMPDDFRTRSAYGVGLDWPLTYTELSPHYAQAERELGVSGDVETQTFGGITFEPGYVYPMRGLPLSYLDTVVAKGIDGTAVELAGERYELRVRPFPQARNGIPNPDYDDGRGFVPVGAVSTNQVEEGGRCQGNNNCVPLCPVQAKYNARKTLAKALQTGCVDILVQTVASKVILDPVTGRVSGIEVKAYEDPVSPRHTTWTMRGHVFVLAANAIENARLMLASGLGSSSGLMGRNLMDHAYLLSWGLLPEVAGTFRGTNCTGGISDLRTGAFRRQQAAFAVDIHNDGWAWAVGSPYSDLIQMVDQENLFGARLRNALQSRISSQLQLAFIIEVPPSESNRVTVDPAYTDQLGNMRPVISYTLPDYTMRGASYARQLARRVFQCLDAADHTSYDPEDSQYVTYEGQGYVIRGGNHLAGTHIMGTSPATSVVDDRQRSWDHKNLYLVGGGSMPTIGTSNITLTLAALCFRSARHIIQQLRADASLTLPPDAPSDAA
ncbi:MAG: GMC family oxidoreductase [Pseudonocardia sp.]|nr:GMC family oxidoreductase [Pseudonocardia sp.]